MEVFSTPEWIGIGLCVLVMGMSKGGLPISGVALPMLVLLWPEQGQAARSAVSFMLPLLCVMDIVGVILYRGAPDWSHLKKLIIPTLAGVVFASFLFIADTGISFSDQTLKLAIGILGLMFTVFHLWGDRIKAAITSDSTKKFHPLIYGFSSGVTSTIAHAAGPVMQMYFLTTGLKKMQFAATTVYYFLFLNTVKLIPFAYFGRFSREQLVTNLWILPVIPVGVLLGYGIVRIMREEQYIKFIYLTLSFTSGLLVLKALFPELL